ncbi:hypothetical protein AKJ16_DCAP17202 [Drosera capensis]
MILGCINHVMHTNCSMKCLDEVAFLHMLVCDYVF